MLGAGPVWQLNGFSRGAGLFLPNQGLLLPGPLPHVGEQRPHWKIKVGFLLFAASLSLRFFLWSQHGKREATFM